MVQAATLIAPYQLEVREYPYTPDVDLGYAGLVSQAPRQLEHLLDHRGPLYPAVDVFEELLLSLQ